MLSDKIKQYRKEMNLTQEQLAKQINVSRSAVAKWEQGKGLPSRDCLDELEKYLKISKDNIIEKEDALLVLESVKRTNRRNFSLILMAIIPLFICVIVMLTMLVSRSSYGKLIHESVSPDGNIILSVYDKPYIRNNSSSSNSNVGYKIVVNNRNISTSYWIKRDCEFIGLYWSSDSRYVVEEYKPLDGNERFLEYADFETNSGVNLQYLLESKLALHYDISWNEIKCKLEFVAWEKDQNIMQVKFELELENKLITGYIFSNPFYGGEANAIIELSIKELN